jgi:S-adenosyl-l-methionine hydroxide adenosyltransferase
MIVLLTDFGLHGPYTGQMKTVLHQIAPGIPAKFGEPPETCHNPPNATGR